MNLFLREIEFPHKTLSPKWFNIDYKITVIRIQSCDIRSIEPNAFNSPSFQTVTLMELKTIPIGLLPYGAFHGLPALRILMLVNVGLHTIGLNLLEPCKNLLLMTMDDNLPLLNFDGLAGSIQMPLLHTIHFNGNNFKNTITNQTFASSAGRLVDISLMKCQIEIIGKGAFAKMSLLKKLDLRYNNMKRLPENIFDFLHGQNRQSGPSRVYLSGNPWRCDSDLAPLKRIMSEHVDAFIEPPVPVCATPINLKHLPLQDLVYNNNLAKIKPKPNELVCRLSDDHIDSIVAPPKAMAKLRLTRHIDGLFLSVKEFPSFLPKSYIIVGFENSARNVYTDRSIRRKTQCVFKRNGGQQQMFQFKLKTQSNRLYRYCIIEEGPTKNSPLDCISFTTRRKKNISQPETETWLSVKHQSAVLSSCVISGALAYTVGIILSLVIARRFPNPLCGRKLNSKKPSDVHMRIRSKTLNTM